MDVIQNKRISEKIYEKLFHHEDSQAGSKVFKIKLDNVLEQRGLTSELTLL